MNPPANTGDIKNIKPKITPKIGKKIAFFAPFTTAGLSDFFKDITIPKPNKDLNNTQKPNKKETTNIASPGGIVMNKIPMMKSIAPDNSDQPQFSLCVDTEKISDTPVNKKRKPTKYAIVSNVGAGVNKLHTPNTINKIPMRTVSHQLLLLIGFVILFPYFDYKNTLCCNSIIIKQIALKM